MTKNATKVTYKAEFKTNHKGDFIRIYSLGDGGHSADYFHYFVRSESGELKEKKVTTQISKTLIQSICEKGPSEGFILREDTLSDDNVEVHEILHRKTSKEVNFTATGDKLVYHWPIFKKLKETGFGSIIRATLTLHQVCSSRCQFCSTINRNKRDSITLCEAKNFVEKLFLEQAKFNREFFKSYNDEYRQVVGSDIRLKGLILSGGGQPNLWPHFSEFVEWASGLNIDLGLITNGFPKSVSDNIYDKFKWIRLSITPEDASPFYVGGRFNNQYLPSNITNNSDISFGLSYVYGPWTTDDIISRISDSVESWNLAYVRFLTDCNLGRSEQLRAHKELALRLRSLGLIDEAGNSSGKIFHQLKYHGTNAEARELFNDGQCLLQAYNVFWDTTGHEANGYSYVYPCDSVTVLADEESGASPARGFDGLKWGTVTNTEVERLFKEPLQPFFDPREICSSCLFMKNNRVAKALKQADDYNMLADPSSTPLHVNFP